MTPSQLSAISVLPGEQPNRFRRQPGESITPDAIVAPLTFARKLEEQRDRSRVLEEAQVRDRSARRAVDRHAEKDAAATPAYENASREKSDNATASSSDDGQANETTQTNGDSQDPSQQNSDAQPAQVATAGEGDATTPRASGEGIAATTADDAENVTQIATDPEGTLAAMPVETAPHASMGVASRWNQRAKVEFLSSQAVLAEARIDVAAVNAKALRQPVERPLEEVNAKASGTTPDRATRRDDVAAPQSSPATSPTSSTQASTPERQAAIAAPEDRAEPARKQHSTAQAGPDQAATTKALETETPRAVTRDATGVVAPATIAAAARDAAAPKANDGSARGVAAVAGTKAQKHSPLDTLTHQARPAQEQLRQTSVQQAAVRGVAMAFQAGGGEATVTLSPEALGRLRVQVQVRDGVVEATFRTTTQEAFTALHESRDALRASLESQGMQVERVVVEPPPQPVASAAPAQEASQPSNEGSTKQGERDAHQRRDDGAQRNDTGQARASDREPGPTDDGWTLATPRVIASGVGLEWVA